MNQPMRSGVAVDELGSNTLRVQQVNERERVFVAPDVSPGAIQMELSLSTTEAVRNGSDVDLFGRREHHLRIFHRHAGRHPMDEHIGAAEEFTESIPRLRRYRAPWDEQWSPSDAVADF